MRSTHPILESYGKWITFWMDKVSGAIEGTPEHFVEDMLQAFPAPDPNKFERNPETFAKNLRKVLAKTLVKRSPMQRTNFYSKFEKSVKQLLEIVSALNTKVRGTFASMGEKWRGKDGVRKFVLSSTPSSVTVLERGKVRDYLPTAVASWERVSEAPKIKGVWTRKHLRPLLIGISASNDKQQLLRACKAMDLQHEASVLAAMSEDEIRNLLS